MNNAPPCGFYVSVARLKDEHGEFMRFLAGPFRQWADANALTAQASAYYHANCVTSAADFVIISMLQCEVLPLGVFNSELWVDTSKLVS